ncbi:hypothetical protein WA026_023266 [Henosepilachna vigintioctopunctata]|uniref:Kazal-like domain-containing protein n=1 Tax=Henosepilachna vigintioctopunctata TaxID=420089 RepID=A0AAW1V342_9CUCU
MERMKDPKLKNCLDKCPAYLDLNPQCASDGKTYPSTSSFHCMQKCLKPHGEELTIVSRGYCENDIIRS